jgi:PadR family transcriptional regulator
MKGEHLGEFEELVLLAVNRLAEDGHDAYGVPIKLLLDREARRDVSIGAVYAALDRLEAKRLVASADTEGSPTRGGRRRRAFRVLAAGHRTLRAMRDVRERLWRPAPTRGGR